MPRPIVFATDYGQDDEFAGVCRAVVQRLAPEAPLIDLTHGIPARDVLAGALTLARAAPYLSTDAVVLGIVDPGVGSSRLGIAVATARGPLLVGPDNGLLSLAWQAFGGAVRAVALSNEELFLRSVSATFQGRDVFAPVAAHLANGLDLERVGEPVDPGALARVHIPAPYVTDGRAEARVLSVDRFGNVQLNLREAHLVALGARERLAVGLFTLRRARTYADVAPGELAFLLDSSGWVALVANEGSAAVALGIGPRDAVILAAPGEGR